MAPRLFWFLAGGASAFWWVRHHEWKNHQDKWNIGDIPNEHSCMKYSWYKKSRRDREIQENSIADADARREIRTELDDVAAAKERLMTSVRSGIRSVMDTMIGIETAFREERADLLRRRMEDHARGMASPTAPEFPSPTAVQPAVVTPTEKAPTVLTPPTYTPEPKTQASAAADPTMSQILSALENINAKLGSTPSTPKDDKRLI